MSVSVPKSVYLSIPMPTLGAIINYFGAFKNDFKV